MSVQLKRFRNLFQDFVLSCGLSFSLPLSSFISLRIRPCFGMWSSGFPGFSGIGNQEVLFYCSGIFIQVGCSVRTTLRNHTKDCHIYQFIVLGLLRSDCGELCNLFVFFIRYGDFVVLLTLTAIFLPFIVNIQWEIRKLAFS